MALLQRLLITGAAGALGNVARDHLAPLATELRLSDIEPVIDLRPHEQFVQADLGDAQAMRDLVQGCDGIGHFGGVSVEKGFDVIERANIRGMFNIYEAARAAGGPRIVFASSNHAIGFYQTDQRLDGSEAPFADGLYGASKVYGEQLALVYWQIPARRDHCITQSDIRAQEFDPMSRRGRAHDHVRRLAAMQAKTCKPNRGFQRMLHGCAS